MPLRKPELTIIAGLAVGKGLFFNVAALDHLDDGQAEHLGKVVVALVVRRHRHDGARAVGHEHIVGNENGNFLSR